MKIKIVVETVIEVDVDAVDDLGVDVPDDMEDVQYLLQEATSIATSLLRSEVVKESL